MNPLIVYAYYFPLQFLLTVSILLLISLIAWKLFKIPFNRGRITKTAFYIHWSLVNYTLLLLYITTFGRRSLDYYQSNLNVGYSYRLTFMFLDKSMFKEVTLNILIFIPLGVLCALAFRRFRFFLSAIYGFALSAFIEYSQFYLRKGTFEYDDMISNTLGTIIGCILLLLVQFIYWFLDKYLGEDL